MKLGDRVRDKLTGFEGIITTQQRHLTGCDSVWVTSQSETHEGKPIERHFDVLRVEVLESGAVVLPRAPEVPAAG